MTLTKPQFRQRFINVIQIPVLSLSLLLSCTSASPKITLSREKVPDRGIVEMEGTGFSPKASVMSHLKRPDGTEFPPLRFITDDKGEFAHKINTMELQLGTHAVWVIDRNGVTSNVERFEVLPEQK